MCGHRALALREVERALNTSRLAQDLSHPLITTLQQECTRQTCPEMKAGEWLYLCVAHGNEGAMEVSSAYKHTRDIPEQSPSNAVR